MTVAPLRVRFDDAAQLRAHMRDTRAGSVLLLSRAGLEPGARVNLELEVLRGPHYLTLEAVVRASSPEGCVMAVPAIGPLQGKAWLRRERRFPLALGVEASISGHAGHVQLRDVSFGGARLGEALHVGTELELRVEPGVVLRAIVTWTAPDTCGVRWVRTHGPTRLGALKLLQRAVGEWDRIPLVSHPAACACSFTPALA